MNEEAAGQLRAPRPREWQPLDLVFPSVPSLKIFKRDPERAGIAYCDAEGKQGDFYSLRYAFCTFLARANVPIRTAMELMRHRDIKLTLAIYTRSRAIST